MDSQQNTEPGTTDNQSQNGSQTTPQPTWDAGAGTPSAAHDSASQAGMPASDVMPAGLPSDSATVTPTGPVVMPDNSKKKRLILVSIIAGAVVLLGGASAAAYYGYVLPNKPQNILDAALVNQVTPGKVNTTTFHGTFNAKQAGEDMAMSGNFKGTADKNGPFDISGDFDAMVTKVTFDVRSVDGKDYYVRVGGLDGLDSLMSSTGEGAVSAYAPLVSAVNNQWFIINQSLIKQLDPTIDMSNTMTLSDSDVHKLSDAYKHHRFLVVQEKLKDENVSGHDSRHLKVVVDKTQLKAFASELKAANISKLKITDNQLKDFNKAADNANFSKYPVDVWVSKADKLIDQISFTTSDKDGSFTAKLSVDNWNKAVKVDKPAGAKSLLDILGHAYGDDGLNALEGDLTSMDGNGISL